MKIVENYDILKFHLPYHRERGTMQIAPKTMERGETGRERNGENARGREATLPVAVSAKLLRPPN